MSVQPEPHDFTHTVLIADDDHWTTRSIKLVLDSHPRLRVLDPVHSGEAAVEAYRAGRPDLVLMDVNMPPGISGVEATARIRQFDPEARILVLTTVAPGPGLARALEAGAMAAVNKTASEQALLAAVLTAAKGESPRLLKQLVADISIAEDALPEATKTAPLLTDAEYQVLQLVCDGLSYSEIASWRCVSEETVRSQTKALREKLGADNLAQLVVRAMQHRFVSY